MNKARAVLNCISGCIATQKTFTIDFLNKRMKTNEGEVPQYYVENSHAAIIPPEVFDLVQSELNKRKGTKGHQSGASPFSSKLICGECGSFYGSKVWHSTSKYRRTVWQCNGKFKNENICQTPHFDEGAIKEAFVDAFQCLL
ncbi:MAG: recombinase zinc beta ribbon domain-containing protein, partial [Ruthenibacterium sp.]